MIIEIQLANPKYCNGCPCIGLGSAIATLCCQAEGGMEYDMGENADYIPRPQQCIDKYGE